VLKEKELNEKLHPRVLSQIPVEILIMRGFNGFILD
jgi:hypothetical protein